MDQDLLHRLFPVCWNTLGIAAPSSMPDEAESAKALRFLSSLGMKLVYGYDPEDKASLSYLSASREKRLEHLNGLIRDPRVQAIYCLRGGFGAIHLLDGIDFETLRERKLPLIGFSDITALHMAMLRKKAGIPIAGCMALRLEEDSASDDPQKTFSSSFCRAMTLGAYKQGLLPSGMKRPFRAVSRLTALNQKSAGSLQGKIICANMTVLASLCGTTYLPSFKDQILILEEVGEKPRRIDAYLSQLHLNRVFTHCKAVIFADFKDCPDQNGDLHKMLSSFAQAQQCPVFSGLHFGHCKKSLSFVLQESCRIENSLLFCRFLE